MEITVERVNKKVHLRAHNGTGNTVDVDGSETVGGEGQGFRPMQLVLAAIASCSTMDLVPILEKQRQQLDDLKITVTGERPDTVPSPFSKIHLHFDLYGTIEEAKAARAVELAVTKYCSVGEMLKQTVDITYSHTIHPADA
jgi:putative redox protein